MWKARRVWRGNQNKSANWPGLAETGGRPALALALAGRAGGRTGRSLWAAVCSSHGEAAFEQLEQRCGGAEEVRRPGGDADGARLVERGS